MSRRYLRHSVFTVQPGIPDNRKNALLRVQVSRWSAFRNTKYAAQWAGRQASVYAWDQDEIKKSIVESGHDEKRCAIWPEGFIRTRIENGARLIAAIEGFEGQVWKNGFLTASRWWHESPHKYEWDLFLRAAGVSLDQLGEENPEAVHADFLDTPWTHNMSYVDAAWSLLEDPKYAAVIIAIVTAPFIYLASEYITLVTARSNVDRQLSALSVETEGIRKLRNMAINNLGQINDYLALEVYPSQLSLISTASGLLSTYNVRLIEWNYDVGTLSFTLTADHEIDATGLITTFEKSGTFSNVSASRTGPDGQVRARMDVRPMRTRPENRLQSP